MTMSDPRLGMVAGEPSGDLLAQLLLGGLKQRWPALQSFGLGGPQMQTQGFDAWWNYDLLAVHGYSLELPVLSAKCGGSPLLGADGGDETFAGPVFVFEDAE